MKIELKQKAATLPLLPGVYLMKDQMGSIIYVGKSKHLKKRVTSYFGQSKHRPRKVERMIKQIMDFDYIVVDTELDALLLECQLIKEIRPIYNKLLKNDSRYRYIHLNEAGSFPYFESVYEKKEKGLYFGPYDMKNELDYAIECLNEYYLLANCKGRPNRECCVAHLKNQCLAPCDDAENGERYLAQVHKAIRFLEKGEGEILAFYQRKMQEASENLLFEKANWYKEAYKALMMLTYREAALAWSLSKTRTIAFIPKPTGGIKVYLLIGAHIIKTLSVQRKQISPKWEAYFNIELNRPLAINKEEVDRAYIIYAYLRRNSECMYYEI